MVAKSGAVLEQNQRLQLNGFHTDAGPATVFLMTRYQDIGLPNGLPRELVIDVRCPGNDLEDAVHRAATLATSLTPLISFTVNAFVDVPRAHIAYEGSAARMSRRFWQADVHLGTALVSPIRTLRHELLFPLLNDVYANAEHARLARATSQYHAALRNWTTAGQPLALMHLYPALEALAPAVERVERERLGLANEREHAERRGVDLRRSNWKEVLLGRIRRDVICKGDERTYKIAIEASNGLEHGSLDMPHVREAAPQVTRQLFNYVRRGVLDLLTLDSDVRHRLADLSVIDVTPFESSITGVLIGDVADPDQLGIAGDPYPRMDWTTTIDDLEQLPDGKLTVKPNHTFTAQIAPGVQFQPWRLNVAVGLNDPAQFEAAPGPAGNQ